MRPINTPSITPSTTLSITLLLPPPPTPPPPPPSSTSSYPTPLPLYPRLPFRADVRAKTAEMGALPAWATKVGHNITTTLITTTLITHLVIIHPLIPSFHTL